MLSDAQSLRALAEDYERYQKIVDAEFRANMMRAITIELDCIVRRWHATYFEQDPPKPRLRTRIRNWLGLPEGP